MFYFVKSPLRKGPARRNCRKNNYRICADSLDCGEKICYDNPDAAVVE